VGAAQFTFAPHAKALAGTVMSVGQLLITGGVVSITSQHIGTPPTLSPPITVKFPKVVPIVTGFVQEVLMFATTTRVVLIVTRSSANGWPLPAKLSTSNVLPGSKAKLL
jgi:hypothetical protein